MSELSKVRESEQSNDHNKEMLKLAKHEIEQLRQQVKEKEQTNSDLHRKCTQLQQDLAGNQELLQQSQQQSRFSQSADRNNIAASLATNGRIYEPMVGGGVGTATPQYFGSVAHRDLEQALQEKSAQAALYKVNIPCLLFYPAVLISLLCLGKVRR